jgi:dTDP-4-amino-4,6-dideoxygalactose transaminase
LARKHNLIVIEDAAQAPGAMYNGKYAGALGHVGVFSLNYHKHIHCGEGGVVVTDDDTIADRVRLIRNHAESVVGDKHETNLVNMVGFNFRMTEVEAAIARCQLKKLKLLLEKRQKNCRYIADKLREIPAIVPPLVRDNCTHAYYVHPFKFKEEAAGVSRDSFIEAVRAELPASVLREDEGPLISCGYVKPLYLQPLYQKRIAYGSMGFPFSRPTYEGTVSYEKGICPVTERMYEKELFIHELMHSAMGQADMDDLVKAFFKVWESRGELKTLK